MRKTILQICISLLIVAQYFVFSTPVFAQTDSDEDKAFLLMYFKEEELVVEAPTRGQKSITQTAENVTVVTANDIKLMNAHTLADVLNTVTGVQVFMGGGPGSSALAAIQGSDNRHVTVFLDGVALNNLSDNAVDVGSFPVQNIEKIEIIKGPASSAWGSALGGVINIITKSGKGDVGGLASASYGERNTGDGRVEASGKAGRFGYYLAAGRLQTDGFQPHNDFSGNNIYYKMSYGLTEATTAFFTFGYNQLTRGEGQFPAYDLFLNNNASMLFSTLSINSSLSQEVSLNISLWQEHQILNIYYYQLSTGSELPSNRYDDSGYGASAKLAWKHQEHNLVLGADIDSRKLESDSIADNEQGIKKWALFLNDTVGFGPFSVIPGVRYDTTDTNGDFWSPSLGMTYKITEDTLVRAYAARGFNIPPLGATYGDNIIHVANPGLKMEQVWSYQLGVESTAVKHLWMKASLFRNDIRDIIQNVDVSATQSQTVNGGRERRQGTEIELRTEPVYHSSLMVGAAFMSAKNVDTDQTIPDVPLRTYDIGLLYDDHPFHALLKGHYIDWNQNSADNGKYGSFVFDAHISASLSAPDQKGVEIYVDVHNILNTDQYAMDVYKNPGRWVEAGLRYQF